MIWRMLAHCSVRLRATCIEFVYKCFPAFLPAQPVETENLSSVCRQPLCVNWAHRLQNSIKNRLIVQRFYLFMSPYRERLQGNWLHHYQRAESARVSDKRLKKICLHLLFLYAIIPPSISSFLSLSLSVCFRLTSTESSNQHFGACSTCNSDCSCNHPPILFNVYNMCWYSFTYRSAFACLWGGW